MKKLVIVCVFLSAVAALAGFVFYLFITNRTVSQAVAMSQEIGSKGLEFTVDPPLTKFRRVAELDIVIPDYDHNPNENLPWGQFRLPDGRVAEPQIEGVDESGNVVSFKHTGFTISSQDSVVFSPRPDLGDSTKLVKIRIRSDEPFTCEAVIWRNRNPK